MNDQEGGRRWVPQRFLNHLNQRHADTVLFLGQYLTGDPRITAAELVGVEAQKLTLRLETAQGWDTVAVSLDITVESRAELLGSLSRLLHAARIAAPTEPLISLEEQHASSPHPRRH